MKRERIMVDYKVNLDSGIIQSPSKFEGEMLYAPYFYNITLDGCSEELSYMEDGMGEYVALVGVDDEDRKKFPELDTDTTFVLVCENDQGFVSCRELTDDQADKVRDEYELENAEVEEIE